MTQCIPSLFTFQNLGAREVVAAFDGGKVTTDAGGLLLREVDQHFGFVNQFARCFTDHRDPEALEHPVADLLKQRIFGLCLGYEDLKTITTDSGTIRSWLSWSAKKIRWAKTAFASVIAAKPWPAKARSIVWN